MKIAIDARLYGLKNRGIGRYLVNLIANLEKIDNKNFYYIFLNKDNFDEYIPHNDKFKKILINIKWYGFAEQVVLPIILKKYKFDLIHFAHFNVPFFLKNKIIITVHDLTLIYYPDRRASTLPPFFYQIKYKVFKWLFKRNLLKAKMIIAPSNYVKNDLLKYYNLADNKVRVIYEGINQQNIKVNNELLVKYKINKPYIFYIGSAYPHKNLERLIKAFNQINIEKKYQLVIAGKNDYFMEKLKNWVTNSFNERDDIVFTGFINDSELPTLFKLAALFIFPSLSEGFGLPAIEAQYFGCPVVASNQTCLKEVLGKGAIYFNPFDHNDIINKILLLLNHQSLNHKLIKNGLNNQKKYSWEKMAEETLNIYNNFDENKNYLYNK